MGRWAGLVVIVAAFTSLAPLLTGRTPLGTRLRSVAVRPPRTEFLDGIDDPPLVPAPGSADLARLVEAERRLRPALMYVGHPGRDSGTAFVISRRHRLLATVAHVADIADELGGMVAIPEGGGPARRIERIWHHPDRDKAEQRGSHLWMGSRRFGPFSYPGPDVAVLQLEPGGADLPAECPLARLDELRDLASRPVGMLGFPQDWPSAGQPVSAAVRRGTVSWQVGLVPTWDETRRWTMVDATLHLGKGASGGPFFLGNGHVVALFAWSRRSKWRTESIASGIRIDCLWELISHHHLEDRLPAGYSPITPEDRTP